MKSLLDVIVLLGALQGFIIAVLLFTSSKNNRYSNRLLAFFILTVSLACFSVYCNESGLTGKYELIRWTQDLIPMINAMALGPLLYFYSLSMVSVDFRVSKKQRLHFLPMVLDAVPQIIVWIFITGVIFKWWYPQDGRGWGDFIDEWNAWGDIPRWASMSIYTLLSVRIVTKAVSQKPDLLWLKIFLNFVVGFQILWLLFLIHYIIPDIRYSFLDIVGWYPLYIPMAVIVYWLGIRGYIQSQMALPRKTKISAQSADETMTALYTAMEADHLYLDAGLTVAQLSEHLTIPQKTISAVLNQHLHKSFNEFLNEYRIEAVKKRLLSPESSHLTITGIALECGFNSQATFQRAFRAVTNLSPSEFQERHRSKQKPNAISNAD